MDLARLAEFVTEDQMIGLQNLYQDNRVIDSLLVVTRHDGSHMYTRQMYSSNLPEYLLETPELLSFGPFVVNYKFADTWCIIDRRFTDRSLRDSTPHFQIVYSRPCIKGPPTPFAANPWSMNKIKKLANNVTLRHPQTDALIKMRDVMTPKTGPSRFMVILPTGCGKTYTLALAPFVLNARKVLLVTPAVTIREQVFNELSDYYSRDGCISKALCINLPYPSVHRYIANQPLPHTDVDVVICNIQALIKKGRDEDTTSLNEQARDLFSTFKFDLIISDEGHHSPALSWQVVESALLDHCPRLRSVLFTATPARGDGQTFNLERDSFYLYHRQDAIMAKFIKYTFKRPIEVEKPKSVVQYSDPVYLSQLVVPAVKQLQDLRQACSLPLRMLVTANQISTANAVALFINNLSIERSWGLRAAAIHGSIAHTERTLFLKRFKSHDDPNRIDICVQCEMLGEGYDNDCIAVSLFIASPGYVGKLAQYHGRALRVPKGSLDAVHQQRRNAYLFYPKSPEVERIVDGYLAGDDENCDNLFTPLVTLKQMNRELNGLDTSQFIAQMTAQYEDYHALYKEKRVSWEMIPAEWLAHKIFSKYIGSDTHFRLADFGCGEGLFELKMLELLRNERSTASGLSIHVYALDVSDSLISRYPLRERNDFYLYNVTTYVGDFNSSLPSTKDLDCAIFCLSMMARDSLELGLEAAMRVVKPDGIIYIVQDVYKFGGRPNYPKAHRGLVHNWCERFCAHTGFHVRIENSHPIENSQFCVVELVNVGVDEELSVRERLSGITFSQFTQDIPRLTDANQTFGRDSKSDDEAAEEPANEQADEPTTIEVTPKRQRTERTAKK